MDAPAGTIECSHQDGIGVLTLRGEHDLSTAPVLQREIDGIYDRGSTLVVDLTHIEFVDSSILNVLVRGCERAARSQHRFALVCPADSLGSRILDLVIGDRVPRFETREAALTTLAEPAPG
jgi:anti-sigma B factor antagonist